MANPTRHFDLLPGLRWQGQLHVLHVDTDPPRVVVAFEAQDRDGNWVFDHAPLTLKQFKDWTGKDPPAPPTRGP